jgi:putative inorganic carbon (hco3(-)) transporter
VNGFPTLARGRFGGGASSRAFANRMTLAAALALGVCLGAVAVVAGSGDGQVGGLLVIAAAAPFVAMVLGEVRRVLLALVILDIPFQWDVNLWYQFDAAELGALGGLNISLTTLALGALYALWTAEWLAGADDFARPRIRAALPLLVYVGFNVASVVVARNTALAWFEVALLAQTLLVFVYVASRVRTRSDVGFIVTLLLASLLLESLVIIAMQVTGLGFDALGLASYSHDDPAVTTQRRAGGTIGGANTTASFLAMLLPVAAAVLATPASRRLRRLALAALASGSVALILTFSRGGWASVTISTALLLVLGWRRGLVPPRVVGVVVLVVLLVAAPLYGALGARLTADDSGSAASRVPLMELSVNIIEDQPTLGVGVNNFAEVVRDYAGPEFSQKWIYIVHNKYLLVWAEAGIGALLGFLWFLGAIIRRGIRCWRAHDRLLSPIALGLTVAVIGQMVQMTVEIFQNRVHVQLLSVVAGLITALHAMTVEAERT